MARSLPRFVPLSTAIIACVPSSVGFQPEIEPSSLTKMNLAGAETPFLVTWKNAVPLRTIPVGLAPSLLRAAVGIVTTNGTGDGAGVPAWSSSGNTQGPLSLTLLTGPAE